MFCNIINIFTVTFDEFLMNKILISEKNDLKRFNGRVSKNIKQHNCFQHCI